jgi:hypothetical protein
MKKQLWEGVQFILVINFFVIPLWSLAITERVICWPHRTLPFYGFFLEVIRKMRGNFRPENLGSNTARRSQRSLRSAHLHSA